MILGHNGKAAAGVGLRLLFLARQEISLPEKVRREVKMTEQEG